MVTRQVIRQRPALAGDSWVQTKFIGGLILLAGVVSLVMTSDLQPARGSVMASQSPAISGHMSMKPEHGECGTRKIDLSTGAELARAQ